jgi:SAM-dependent methyltransferase
VAREQRLVFGEVAELYDRARPSYPTALVDDLVALADQVAAPGTGRVLDVGCGTGKATVLLAARGLGGVGVEPDPDMAALAQRNLAAFARWEVEKAEFEALFPPERGPFDVITCGQAWHWLDPSRRFQHASRLLRPGGWLALFWNRTTTDTSEIRGAIDAVYAETFPTLSPHGYLTAGQPPAGDPPPESGFVDGTWRVFRWMARYTTAEWLELVQTYSDHRMLPAADREILLQRLAAVIDARGGTFDHPYDCWLWSARRL